ncbi:MAG: hypothetical protein IJK58_05690 [Clostridia bacterium]|nr:hypothetical protein [Clostridia bacterium]
MIHLMNAVSAEPSTFSAILLLTVRLFLALRLPIFLSGYEQKMRANKPVFVFSCAKVQSLSKNESILLPETIRDIRPPSEFFTES